MDTVLIYTYGKRDVIVDTFVSFFDTYGKHDIHVDTSVSFNDWEASGHREVFDTTWEARTYTFVWTREYQNKQ